MQSISSNSRTDFTVGARGLEKIHHKSFQWAKRMMDNDVKAKLRHEVQFVVFDKYFQIRILGCVPIIQCRQESHHVHREDIWNSSQSTIIIDQIVFQLLYLTRTDKDKLTSSALQAAKKHNIIIDAGGCPSTEFLK
eukprot:m.1183254 g.1183254  ORF g.1183254 m.1183254 type:complete len:136 (+) comp24540_c1_seq41:1125-1532(+)